MTERRRAKGGGRQTGQDDADDVMPARLTPGGMSGTAAEQTEAMREWRGWLIGHGIDQADWTAVRAAIQAAQKAHGIPTAEERHAAWVRSQRR